MAKPTKNSFQIWDAKYFFVASCSNNYIYVKLYIFLFILNWRGVSWFQSADDVMTDELNQSLDDEDVESKVSIPRDRPFVYGHIPGKLLHLFWLGKKEWNLKYLHQGEMVLAFHLQSVNLEICPSYKSHSKYYRWVNWHCLN